MSPLHLADRIISGTPLSDAEAMALADTSAYTLEELFEAARRVTDHFHTREFDTCSIINARSGRCGEDCKWCAQAARYATGAAEYPLVDRETCLEMCRYNAAKGIGRFSLVTSGRLAGPKAMETICGYYRDLAAECPGMGLCASLGLVSPEALEALRAAGVERYHCNMETAPSHFPTLCTTHTQAEKLATIEAARRAGLKICSGGIIGMGETFAQRIEFALLLRSIDPVSIPLNVLQPIPGTPLGDQPPLSDDEILAAVAVMRLVNPRASIRFAGGRARISPEAQRRALAIGVNGAIMGDLLTTVGAMIDEDLDMIRKCGYTIAKPHKEL
ncbi:MAG: biotin synthase BioB [Duncaniella sp.]|nr:biotin synthase BioB [Duncaniella sp.]